MKNQIPKSRWRGGTSAFTLIELLAVIAIIALLASLVVGLTSRASRAGRDSKLKVLRDQLVTAIEDYHSQFNYYPPDNRGIPPQGWINSVTNSLYYELTGTILDNQAGEFFTPDRSEVINAATVQQLFGVEGFVNSVQSTGDLAADSRKVRKFIELKSEQIGEVRPGVTVLAVPLRWPLNPPTGAPAPVQGNELGLNPWRYVSTNPYE